MSHKRSYLAAQGALYRARLRRTAGGAVMFIVAMTLAIIAAMGAYALNISAEEIRTAGFVRQQVQTLYLSQYGVQSMAQVLTGANTLFYNTLMMSATQRDTQCVSLYAVYATGGSNANAQSLACHRAGSPEILNELFPPGTTPTATSPLVAPWSNSDSNLTRGSVGLPVAADFFVEVTDPNQRPPPPGYDVEHFCSIDMTTSAYGMTPTGVTAATLSAYQSEGLQQARGRVIAGPMTLQYCKGL